MLTDDEVRHIAKLAKIKLTDADIARLAPQISGILDYFEVLKEVDTEGVAETSQVTGLESVTRPDEINVTENEAALLECSPHPIEDNCIRIPKIM